MAMNIDKARTIAEEMRGLLEERLAEQGYTMGITQVQHGLRNPNVCSLSFTIVQATSAKAPAAKVETTVQYETDYKFPKEKHQLVYLAAGKEETYGELWAVYEKADGTKCRMNCMTGKRTKISDKILAKLAKEGLKGKHGAIPKAGDQVICFDPNDDEENVYHGVMVERVGKRKTYKVDLGMDFGNVEYPLGNVVILSK